MRFAFFLCFLIIIGCAPNEDTPTLEPSIEAEEEGASWAGSWTVDALPMEGDSALVTVSIIGNDTPEGWSTTFNHLDGPVLANSVVIAGDSVIIESGPYPSALREGAIVTSLTSVLYVAGDDLIGHYTADYDSGEPAVAEGRLLGRRVN